MARVPLGPVQRRPGDDRRSGDVRIPGYVPLGPPRKEVKRTAVGLVIFGVAQAAIVSPDTKQVPLGPVRRRSGDDRISGYAHLGPPMKEVRLTAVGLPIFGVAQATSVSTDTMFDCRLVSTG